ncbi:MAG TPA: AAA family ATPase [Kofleriaceae bacterium]|nr:AAA family ATPase [Kofleriaceae bacterium]
MSSLSYAIGGGSRDPSSLTAHEFESLGRDAHAQGFHSARAAMQVVVDQSIRTLWNATHPDVAHAVKKAASGRAQRFCELVESLLGGPLDWVVTEDTLEPRPLFRGMRFEPNKLSPGERVLLDWAVVLHLRDEANLGGRVVLIDEPEQHLHPDVCWKAIGRLREELGPDGQLWIATHSLPLVAQAEPTDLFFVEGGSLVRASNTPSRVWSSLLGSTEGRDRMLAFLDGDTDLACARYAAQCLVPPVVKAGTKSSAKDPQGEQLLRTLSARRGRSPLRVLDYGAGKGRLAAFLAERLREGPVNPRLVYVAYNDEATSGDADRTACADAIAKLNRINGVTATYTEDPTELHARPRDHFDVVVLANVLHEIPTQDWLTVFHHVAQCGTKNSVVLVIEDQEPRVGELPHPKGYLILDKQEWRTLLDDDIVEDRQSWNGRDLTAFEIRASSLSGVTADRMTDALHAVRRRCKSRILRLRQSTEGSIEQGRRHALFAIMHVNATLGLDALDPDAAKKPSKAAAPRDLRRQPRPANPRGRRTRRQRQAR